MTSTVDINGIESCLADDKPNIRQVPSASHTAIADAPSNDSVGPTLRIWEVDVSQYEQGDALGRQSYLLQLITTSHQVEKLSASDVQFLFDSKLLQTWISGKKAAYSWFIILDNMINLTLTVLILSDVIAHGGDRNTRPLVVMMASQLTHFLQQNLNSSNIYPYNTESVKNHLSMGIDLSQERIANMCMSPESKTEVVKQSNELLKQITNYLDVTTREFHLDIQLGFDDWLGIIIMSILVLKAVIDIWFRQDFLWSNYNFKSKTVSRGIIPVIERRLPGSYVDNQLMALIYSSFAVIVVLIWSTEHQQYITPEYPKNGNETFRWFVESIKEFQSAVNESADMENIISNMYVICLLLSFLHTVHALRLIPGINFFVITTKKMSKHLVEFGVIFTIVFFGFAAVFYMVMRDPDCPVDKMPEFATVSFSLYYTYSVIMAHVVPNFTQSVRSRIAYVACTIFSVIILLNLIIAVMTMTASDLVKRPWKMVLCRMELWREVLGTEARVMMMKKSINDLIRNVRKAVGSSCCKSHNKNENKLILKVVHFE
jgi:hypothetical protein